MASIRQRPDGKWRARYRDAAGREHAKHLPTKKAAQKWLDGETAALVTGQWADPTAGRISWDEWAATWAGMQVWTDGTHKAARVAVDSVSWRAMREVKMADVQSWVTAEDKRGLAALTIRTRLNYVQMAFRAAVDNQVIPKSPAVRVKSPRMRKREATMKILTASQVAAALDHAGEFRLFVAVCAFAGLRLGEAAGLQVGDLDLENNVLSVHRQVQGSSIPTTSIEPPKAGSERDIYIPVELADMLRGFKDLEPATFIFRTGFGHLYNRNSAGEEWRRIRAAAGLGEDFTLHSLRHTFASNLIASGCDVVTVQRALGHSQPSITLNVYSHLWPSAEDKTRAATSAFLGQVLGGKSHEAGGGPV